MKASKMPAAGGKSIKIKIHTTSASNENLLTPNGSVFDLNVSFMSFSSFFQISVRNKPGTGMVSRLLIIRESARKSQTHNVEREFRASICNIDVSIRSRVWGRIPITVCGIHVRVLDGSVNSF